MILNGCLAGLVAITAPCAFVGVTGSVVIGLVAGILVVLAVLFFDKIKIDDPVGALSVHLVNGIWGTLALGLFAKAPFAGGNAQPGLGLFYGGGLKQFFIQLQGVIAVGIFTFAVAILAWWLIKAIMGIRVSREEELRGLDIGEHGIEAYADFQIFTTR